MTLQLSAAKNKAESLQTQQTPQSPTIGQDCLPGWGQSTIEIT